MITVDEQDVARVEDADEGPGDGGAVDPASTMVIARARKRKVLLLLALLVLASISMAVLRMLIVPPG